MADANDAVDPGPPDAGRDAANADDGSAEAEAGVLIADIDALQRERDDLLGTTQRLQADFENYRKRVMREQTALVERAAEGLVEQLLPVLDSFELALLNIGDATDNQGVRKGLELVYSELLGVLERAGLERIAAQDQQFDPNEH